MHIVLVCQSEVVANNCWVCLVSQWPAYRQIKKKRFSDQPSGRKSCPVLAFLVGNQTPV